MTDTYHPVISFYKIFKYAALSVFVLVFIKYFIYDIYVTNKKPSPFRKIADITNNIFEEMNNVELPAVSTISEHTVKCRVAANTLERSLTFKSYGNSIATGLRDIGKEIREAGILLQKMYSKGSSLQTSFDIEIGAIKQRLNSKSNYMRQDDASYIKERLDILVKKIKELRLLVEKGHNHILDAMKIRSDINDDIKNGLGAADKYSNNTKHSADIVRAKKELADVDKVLSESIIIVGHLQRLRDILNDYGNKLMDVSDELDEMGNEGRRVTKKDLKQLTLAVDHSKAHHHKFNKLAQVPD
ncbi:hypothetical protein C1645_244684 [Glomus cerebriforme]|uniref:Uncharacterized protein n=1 Tax=Glomus cerebriforme TaxID=658196 RepID=A0A397SQM9_9GLOM|nr:hypothetical protein C1645_244684 [Glomus cerebriforme]